MKKLLGIVVMGLLWCSNAYAGWSSLGQLIENVFGIPYEVAGFIIGILLIIIWNATEGEKKKNKYGPPIKVKSKKY